VVWWIVLGALGLIMTALSLVLLWNANREVPAACLGDAPDLSEAIADWRDFVRSRNGTHRDVKMFENRARWLAAYRQLTPAENPSEWIKKLVGLVALEETGAIDLSVNGLSFQDWKRSKLPESIQPILTGNCKSIIERCTEDDWTRYRALAAGTRSEDSTG